MYNRSFLALLLSLLAASAFVACAGQGNSPTPAATYTDITPQQLAHMMEDKEFPFINTHTPYEVEIERTDAFIPFNEIGQSVDELPADKSAKIVLYCRSGSMSAAAAEILVAQGYRNVYNLAGGMIAWREAGYPLLQDGE
jgi:phage shock protein E